MHEVSGRCWVVSELGPELAKLGIKPIHHPVPQHHEHRGHDNNPDGWLTYSDALQRSCNIYFETVADRLKQPRVTFWYDQFGFGRSTGIGIAESRGLIPGPSDSLSARMENCASGIGQMRVLATPLQIANEAATIARNGIWMRPRLLTAPTQADLDGARPRPSNLPPDQVDLHLNPVGLEQAKLGMWNVVNTVAGSGNTRRYQGISISPGRRAARRAPGSG